MTNTTSINTTVTSIPTFSSDHWKNQLTTAAPVYVSTPSHYNSIPVTWDPGTYNWSTTIQGYWPMHHNFVVTKTTKAIDVCLENDTQETITREELVKYLSERKLVRENELVSKMYDRYQVAVKLARSDDDGDTGVRGS